MDYITAEEFEKQPEKVQKVLSKWFWDNLNDFSLFEYTGNTAIYKKKFPQIAKDIDVPCMKNEIAPMYSESELRHFIEEKGYKFIGIDNFNGCQYYLIEVFKKLDQVKANYAFASDDLLNCYWQIACRIAEEE